MPGVYRLMREGRAAGGAFCATLLLTIVVPVFALIVGQPARADMPTPPDINPSARGSTKGTDAAVTVLKGADLPKAARAAMLKAVEGAPKADRWSGELDSLSFGVSVRRLPAGNLKGKATPLLLNTTQMVAIEELLLTKAIVRPYSESGLTDMAALRRAIARSSGDLRVVGRVKGLLFEARPSGDFAVAYVVAKTSRLSAHLAQAKELEVTRSAYLEVNRACNS